MFGSSPTALSSLAQTFRIASVLRSPAKSQRHSIHQMKAFLPIIRRPAR